MLFPKTINTLYVELLVRNSFNYSIQHGWSVINYKTLIKHNPLAFHEDLLKIATKVKNDNGFRSTRPLTNATDFLFSANLLFNYYSNGNDQFKNPGVAISSFTCELFIKFWMHEEKEKKYIPFYENDIEDNEKGLSTIYWAFYTGSESKNYLSSKKIKGAAGHDLEKLFKILPDNVINLHRILYKQLYFRNLNLDIESALKQCSTYFQDSRYHHEDENSVYDFNLSHSLANFFYDVINYIINFDK